MKYNFDEIIDRRGTNSYKWDLVKEEGVIPMWVADMDFQTAPCIIEALQKRVAHGIFGYTLVSDSYYEAIISWFSRRHQWNIQKDWILYTSGVVPAISCCLKAICMPGEKVLVQTPVYNCFFSCIKNSGCEVVENELRRVGNCTYEIDFEENPAAGEGHFIHTYKCDGNPLPSFEGEPKLIAIPDAMDAFADSLWNSLNADNKVSLFVRYIDIATGTYETKIINKNQ